MNKLWQLRLAKAWFSLSHPSLWRGLRLGVVPSLEHRDVLQSLQPDLLLDVGANRGQFSLMARQVHPGLRIHAFEPLLAEAVTYGQIFTGSSGVELHHLALGDQPGTASLHISRRADSSSLLPIGELQTRLFPHTEEVGTHQVSVVLLDSLPALWQGASCALLKIDVQGFELSVLRGAQQALKHCAYVYAECSEVPLYTGQALYPEIEAFLRGEGFALKRRANEQWVEGRLVQADYLFSRAS